MRARPGRGGLWPEGISGHEWQSQRRDQLPGVGVRVDGHFPALPEEGLGLFGEVRVIDAGREFAVTGNT